MFDKRSILAMALLVICLSILACGGITTTSPSGDKVATQVAATLTAVASSDLGGQPADVTNGESQTVEDSMLNFLYVRDNALYEFDLADFAYRVFDLDIQGDLAKVVFQPEGSLLAYQDDTGMTVIDIRTRESLLFLAKVEVPREVFSPHSWSNAGYLLVNRYWGSDNVDLGWVSLDEPNWHALPLPDGVDFYGCLTGVDWAPDEAKVAIAGIGYAHPCNNSPGLTIVDLDDLNAERVVSRSISSDPGRDLELIAGAHTPAWSPSGEWIAFGLDENATGPLEFPTRLYIARPDGSDQTALSVNSSGIAEHPIWAAEDKLFYSLDGDNPETDGLYLVDLSLDEQTRIISEPGAQPVMLTPDGKVLLYSVSDGSGYRAYDIHAGRMLTIPEELNDALVSFVGWLAPD